MKKETNDTIIYTAADIHKYLSGGLTPVEMHAVERAALDDPFLAEAIEGYEAMKDSNWQSQLVIAKQNFEAITQAKIIPLVRKKNDWWKVAAAAAVLVTSFVVVYKTSKDSPDPKNKKTIAKVSNTTTNTNTNIIDSSKTNLAAADSNTAAAGNISANNIAANKTGDRSKIVEFPRSLTEQRLVAQLKDTTYGIRRGDNYAYVNAPPKTKDAVPDYDGTNKDYYSRPTVSAAPAEEKTMDRKSEANNTMSSTVVIGYGTTKKKAVEKTAAASTAFVAAPSAATQQVIQYNHPFSAQVLGADNVPLPFANVSIKSEGFGTYADVKGNFRLVSTDSLITVQVKSAGYLPRQFVLRSNGQQNKLILSEDEVAIKDVTIIHGNVTGKATRQAKLVRDSIVNVEPADGWDNYTTYISNNIDQYSLQATEVHGEMEISFNVKPDYSITDIKIDKSQCNNCDEEAVKKLIEQGPQWKTKRGKGGKAKIKLQF